MEEAVTAIAAQGLSVGVHVVVTASRWADIRPALKDQLGTRVELCLGDPADSEMDRKRARLLGARPPGHGITRDGLEFVHRPAVSPTAPTWPRVAARLPRSGRARRCDSCRRASATPTSPRSPRGQIAIGLGEDELRPVAIDFAAYPHLLILGDTECGKTATLRTLCREIVRTARTDAARILVVDFRRTLLGVVESDHLLGYAMSGASADAHVATAVEPADRPAARRPGDPAAAAGPVVVVGAGGVRRRRRLRPGGGHVGQSAAAAARPAAARQGSRSAPGDRPSFRRCGAGDVRPDPGAACGTWAAWV